MEFIKKAFGDSENGVRAGGILSTVLGSALGFYFGGGIGAVLGLIGGTLLSPVVNEAFFQIQRSTGGITPKPRNTEIIASTPTREIAAPVLQKSGAYSQTSIRAPILENLEPPPESAIAESFKKRDELWNILIKGGSSLTQFEAKQKETKELEAKTDTFIATIDAYERVREDYMATDGKRQELVNAVSASMKRNVISNPLTQAEIERFIPTLPQMSAADTAHSQMLMMQAMPDTVTLIPGVDPFPLEAYTRRTFVNDANKNPISEKVERWNAMTKLERLNASLDQLDTMRFNMEHENPIDWVAATGSTTEAERVRKMSPMQMLEYSAKKLDKFTTVSTPQSQLQRAHLTDIARYAKVIAARDKVQQLVETNLGGVVAIYSDFRQNALVPATQDAKEFAHSKLKIFNKTGIAVMDKGTVDIAHAPDGIPCHALTFKDCTAKEGSKETTMIMQKLSDNEYRITHRANGPITNTTQWNKAALKDGGIIVDPKIVTELQTIDNKPVEEALRELVDKVTQAKLLVASKTTPMKQLSEEFELSRPSGMTRLDVSEAETVNPPISAVPAPALKNKENEAVGSKKTLDYSL